jgi:hypothetical protein
MRHGQSVPSRSYDPLFAIRSAERPVNQYPLFYSIVTSIAKVEKRGVPLSKSSTGRSSQLSTERTLRNSALHRKASKSEYIECLQA